MVGLSVCTSANLCFLFLPLCVCVCVRQRVPFCLAPSTANSSERAADRCSTRADLHVCLMSFSLVSLFTGFGGFFPSFFSVGKEVELIPQTGYPAAPHRCLLRERRLPSFPRKEGGACQIITVITLQLLSQTMIPVY